jgi:hypothetical protein
MLPRPPGGCSSLHKGFTAETAGSVPFVRWWGPLGLLAAIRVAIPLAAYSGSSVPGTPSFARAVRDGGLEGDATGFYAATREFMAGWGRMPRPLLALVALAALATAVAVVVAWRRRAAWRPWLVPAALAAFGLVICVDVHWMRPSGAAVFGWPLLWALPMLPYRALGFGLSKHVAWDFGFALSLISVALTVVAVAYLGRNATARRWVGVAAAAFWAMWPLLVGVIAGHHAWSNAQWQVDVGLHNYSEPLSTLLVTTGAALVLSPRLTQMRLALAGCALSAATLVKVSNGLLAAAALAIVFLRGRTRDSLPFAAGALALAPLVGAYWPISYPKLFDNPQSWPRDPFDPAHVVTTWTHSSIFTPHTLAIVVPLAAIGVAGLLRPWQLTLVVAFLLINPVFYSFYANTALHPRFLYASLPELFVLWSAGIAVLVRLLARRTAIPVPAQW